MKVLNNISGNHFNYILDTLDGMDELLLVSPFLLGDFEEFLFEAKHKGIQKVTLVTTLKDNTPDLLQKVDALYSFSLCCMEQQIEAELRIDNKLHGKIYITSCKQTPFKGIITSANFTNMGLKGNHEWGVLIDNERELENVNKDVKNVSTVVTKKVLELIIKDIDEYVKTHDKVKEQELHLNVTKHFSYAKVKNQTDGKKYFFKPLGSSEDPFAIERKHNEDTQTIHFSKQRPKAVRVGDILICFAVGASQTLLGYFEVLTEPELMKVEGERWPWKITVKNLNPNYSNNWDERNITINDTVDSYSKDLPLTRVGRRSLGSLQWGSDKLELDEHFAKHIIDMMK